LFFGGILLRASPYPLFNSLAASCAVQQLTTMRESLLEALGIGPGLVDEIEFS
jgi:hypothetical protein